MSSRELWDRNRMILYFDMSELGLAVFWEGEALRAVLADVELGNEGPALEFHYLAVFDGRIFTSPTDLVGIWGDYSAVMWMSNV